MLVLRTIAAEEELLCVEDNDEVDLHAELQAVAD